MIVYESLNFSGKSKYIYRYKILYYKFKYRNRKIIIIVIVIGNLMYIKLILFKNI